MMPYSQGSPGDRDSAAREFRDHGVEAGEIFRRREAMVAILDQGDDDIVMANRLGEAERRVAARAERYNKYAVAFNQHRREFAASLVCQAFSRTDLPVFPTSRAAESGRVLHFAAGER